MADRGLPAIRLVVETGQITAGADEVYGVGSTRRCHGHDHHDLSRAATRMSALVSAIRGKADFQQSEAK